MTANPEGRQQEKERKESGMAAQAPGSGAGPAWSSPSPESRSGQPHHAPLCREFLDRGHWQKDPGATAAESSGGRDKALLSPAAGL